MGSGKLSLLEEREALSLLEKYGKLSLLEEHGHWETWDVQLS